MNASFSKCTADARRELSALQPFRHRLKGIAKARLDGCTQTAFAIEQRYPCAVVASGFNQKAACLPDKRIGVFLMDDELIDLANGPQDGIQVLETLLQVGEFGVALTGRHTRLSSLSQPDRQA